MQKILENEKMSDIFLINAFQILDDFNLYLNRITYKNIRLKLL